jgi:hypothetical protein
MPPQHIFVSSYKNYSEITDTRKFKDTYTNAAFLSGFFISSNCINNFIQKYNLNMNMPPFNNDDNPKYLKQYASYKVNNSTVVQDEFPSIYEEWRNELNKCYSIMKPCDYLKVIELQKKLEKCH